MDPARVADLLHPFLAQPLSPAQLAHISTYIDLLQRWNARISLTAVRDPESIVTRHFGESLFAAQILFPAPSRADAGASATNHVAAGASSASSGQALTRPGTSLTNTTGLDCPGSMLATAAAAAHPAPVDLLDIGSGAGFPGLPIKLWAPHLRTTLIESQNKKVAFLREVIRALTLTAIDVLALRAEQFPAAASLVTLRAVERFDSILPVAVRVLAPHSRLALLIGESQIPRAQSLAPTLAWHSPRPIPMSSARVLLIGQAR
jgi:16S rRNA (guanine527-N7)-methyltransferase